MQEKIILEQPIQRVWRWHSKYRYYNVYLQKNLFGEWTITQSWGGLKNRLGGFRMMTFTTINEACNQIYDIAEIRNKKGYKSHHQ